MGAFILYHKKTRFLESGVNDIYLKKGFVDPLSISIGDYRLRLYKKQLTGINNYYKSGSDYIFAVGSLFYKGLSYSESLKNLLSDFLNECIEKQDLYGNYILLFYIGNKKEITFCIDPAYIKNAYFDKVKGIITTDFLCLVEAFPGTYKMNHLAIAENLTTGHLISPDTYALGIEKLDRKNIIEIERSFPGITVKSLKPIISEIESNREGCIENANELISNYFESSRRLCEEFGAHIGLTGGFDSRLLLMHARKKLSRLITNSFWRPDSKDYINAKLLAEAADTEFISFEKKQFNKPVTDEMLNRAFYFFDGQIRSQNNWDEEFNMSEYCNQLASGYLVGFHGSGGEQYRNADRQVFRIPIQTYIKHEWMFRQCKDTFIDKNLKNEVYKNIRRKIKRLVDIQNDYIGLYELKRIQNEVWNTANRTTRVNVLNQNQFYFAPFTEYKLSHAAYKYVPFLGTSFSFEIEMLKKLDTKLASVETNYGFNIVKGIPFRFVLVPLIYNLIPRRIFYKFYFGIKRSQSNSFNFDEFMKISNKELSGLTGKIDLKELSRNKNLGDSLRAYNLLLNNIKFLSDLVS